MCIHVRSINKLEYVSVDYSVHSREFQSYNMLIGSKVIKYLHQTAKQLHSISLKCTAIHIILIGYNVMFKLFIDMCIYMYKIDFKISFTLI